MLYHPLRLLIIVLLLQGCKGEDNKLFQKLSPGETGIEFTNTITETKEHNVFTYQYYYNGNGVAAGDVNGDGLADLFFYRKPDTFKAVHQQG